MRVRNFKWLRLVDSELHQFSSKISQSAVQVRDFHLFSQNLFFILLWYSYDMRVRNFKWLRPVDPELHQFSSEINSISCTGARFLYFFSILFSFCCYIAPIYLYEISSGCARWIPSYVNLNQKLNNQLYRCEISIFFYNYFFILLWYSYDMRVQNFKWLRPVDPELCQFESEIE